MSPIPKLIAIFVYIVMIGTASSKMFEGFLLILMRRPVSYGFQQNGFYYTTIIAYLFRLVEF